MHYFLSTRRRALLLRLRILFTPVVHPYLCARSIRRIIIFMEIFAPIEKSFDRSSIFSKKIFQELVKLPSNKLFFSDFFFFTVGNFFAFKISKKRIRKVLQPLEKSSKIFIYSQSPRFPNTNVFFLKAMLS